MTRRALIAAMLVVLAGVCAAGCGYALAGRGNSLPAHIKIIGVPNLANQSSTPGIDLLVTEQIRQEMRGRSGIQVRPDENGADGVLTGAIVQVILRPVAISNVSRTASQVSITVIASLEFRDKKDNDKVLWANPAVQVQEVFDVDASTETVDAATFFRQSANAQERLAKAFARSVVSQIFEAF